MTSAEQITAELTPKADPHREPLFGTCVCGAKVIHVRHDVAVAIGSRVIVDALPILPLGPCGSCRGKGRRLIQTAVGGKSSNLAARHRSYAPGDAAGRYYPETSSCPDCHGTRVTGELPGTEHVLVSEDGFLVDPDDRGEWDAYHRRHECGSAQ